VEVSPWQADWLLQCTPDVIRVALLAAHDSAESKATTRYDPLHFKKLGDKSH
jgi:hypothetical protein